MDPLTAKLRANRRKNGELTPDQRLQIVHAITRLGAKTSTLAAEFGCTPKTIYNTIKRWRTHNSTESAIRKGRPPKFSARSHNLLYLQARRHPFYTYKQLGASVPGSPSRSTIKRILTRYCLAKRVSKKKIPISKALARIRLNWVRKWQRLGVGEENKGTELDLRQWIFSDECSVMRNSQIGNRYAFCLISETYRTNLVNTKIHVKDIS